MLLEKLLLDIIYCGSFPTKDIYGSAMSPRDGNKLYMICQSLCITST